MLEQFNLGSGDQIVPQDRFKYPNVFLRTAGAVGFKPELYHGVLGSRGGLRRDVLAVRIPPEQADKLDVISELAEAYSTSHLINLVGEGRASQIKQLADRPEEFYRKNPDIQFREVYDPRFLNQCYMRAYERSHAVYRNTLGQIVEPLSHDLRYLSLDQAHLHPIVPRQLQRAMAAEVFKRILLRYPDLRPQPAQAKKTYLYSPKVLADSVETLTGTKSLTRFFLSAEK